MNDLIPNSAYRIEKRNCFRALFESTEYETKNQMS
jgi:hypothetical protein